MKTCKYRFSTTEEDCKNQVNAPHDEEYCIFHAPKDKKGMSVDEFNKLILAKIKHEDFVFEGYVFPGDIKFGRVEFSGNRNFDKTKFSGEADFSGAQFPRSAYFRGTQFSGNAYFRGTQFSGVYFNGAQFSGKADFNGAQFSRDAHFRGTQFSGNAYFRGTQFSGVYFNGAQFSREADFNGAQFSRKADQFSRSAYFRGTQFSGKADFQNAQFSGNAYFRETQFSGEAYFRETQFSREAEFNGAQFSGNAYFRGTQFSGEADFLAAQFSGEAHFAQIVLSGELVFTDTKFDDNCRFTLGAPTFDLQQGNRCLIIFERVQFNPYLTYFENIDPTEALLKTDNTSLGFLFRYCQLKDVYFSNCDLSNFSFYKSSFDEARFTSSRWGKKEQSILKIPYIRKNMIFEEVLLNKLKNHNQEDHEDLREIFKIEDIDNYSKIEPLYQSMKVALDRAKDFSEAGWFYFNEFEMKRQALRKNLGEDKEDNKWFNRTKNRILNLLKYDLYFTFAGYGEKPFWSFLWLIMFTFLFAPLHLLSGLHGKV